MLKIQALCKQSSLVGIIKAVENLMRVQGPAYLSRFVTSAMLRRMVVVQNMSNVRHEICIILTTAHVCLDPSFFPPVQMPRGEPVPGHGGWHQEPSFASPVVRRCPHYLACAFCCFHHSCKTQGCSRPRGHSGCWCHRRRCWWCSCARSRRKSRAATPVTGT
jgi:hypothetical protein